MQIRKILASTALAAFIVNTAGCGLLLHPERQGQKSGRIDPSIAIFDGIGLLFFLIPGLVAFAIDFHQGTIYLPGGQSSVGESDNGLRAVKVDGEMTKENIEATLKDALGQEVDITAFNVQAMRIEHSQLNMLHNVAAYSAQSVRL